MVGDKSFRHYVEQPNGVIASWGYFIMKEDGRLINVPMGTGAEYYHPADDPALQLRPTGAKSWKVFWPSGEVHVEASTS
jgi:hypothetical protein